MNTNERESLLAELRSAAGAAGDRATVLLRVANILRNSGNYRWVGLYDVDLRAGKVANIVWSEPGAPEHPVFPVSKGLTGAAITERRTINAGDVAADPRYLTAFGTTLSEIIVPVFDEQHERVIGTIDVESAEPNAFTREVQELLEDCSRVIQPLWKG